MQEKQQVLEAQMEQKMSDYNNKIEQWSNEATQQLELDFSDRLQGNYWARIKDSKQREIDTILHSSSQYFKDLTSLQGDPYLKVLAVFFNPSAS
jgi:DNA anti-recombination protein RmuC